MKWWDETVCRVQAKSLSKQDGRQISIKWKLLYQMEGKLEAYFILLGLVSSIFSSKWTEQSDGCRGCLLYVLTCVSGFGLPGALTHIPHRNWETLIWCRSPWNQNSNVRNNQSGTQRVKLFEAEWLWTKSKVFLSEKKKVILICIHSKNNMSCESVVLYGGIAQW